MAKLCKMGFIPPYAVTGTHSINSKIIDGHITNLERLFENLQSENINISNANNFEMLNDFIETLKG